MLCGLVWGVGCWVTAGAVNQARKNRPKKFSMADINRKPPPYDVEPMIAARKTIPEYEKIGEVRAFLVRVVL